MVRTCILCHVRPAVLPDRERMGRPIKRVCRECHAARLVADVILIAEIERQKRMTEHELYPFHSLIPCPGADRMSSRALQRACAIARANFPHTWDLVMRCTPREARGDQWREMARQALQHAEWSGNPWTLADPLGGTMVEMPDIDDPWEA